MINTPCKQRKKRWFQALFLAAFGCALVLCTGCSSEKAKGGDASGNLSLFATYDALQQEVFWEGDSGGITSYEAVRYSADFDVVKDLILILKFYKSAGYTQGEFLESQEFRNDFPSFAEFSSYDDGDCWTLVVQLKDLNDILRVYEMLDTGMIATASGEAPDRENMSPISAEYYIQDILSQGGREATSAEIATLHLPE